MQDHNHNNNGNLNNPFPKPIGQNDAQLPNNSYPNQNHPQHRNYVERVIDYKFVPVMPVNMNQPTYTNTQPIVVQQPNTYYQPVNGFQQSQQPLLQQFIVPPSSVGSDFNNYQFQQPFFEPPFSPMPFDNFYPNANMLNPMDFNFNNNQNNFMSNFPNPNIDNQAVGYNNYNVNNQQSNQPQQNVNQANMQQAAVNNQLNEKVDKYEQQLENLNNKYTQLSNSKYSAVFDEKLTNLEEKIVKLKNKLSEVELFEDEIDEGNIDLEQDGKNANKLKKNQLDDTSKVLTKKQKVKKALIVSALLILFIGIAVGAYFGYTLWLKGILIDKLKWKWLL